MLRALGVKMLIRWRRTLWRSPPPQCANSKSQCAQPPAPCGPEWAAGLTEQHADPQLLAGAFRAWAQRQPQFEGMLINVQYVLELYAAARCKGWPCSRDFLRELGRLMPKGRVWREGQALTVYAVPKCEVVPMTRQGERRVA